MLYLDVPQESFYDMSQFLSHVVYSHYFYIKEKSQNLSPAEVWYLDSTHMTLYSEIIVINFVGNMQITNWCRCNHKSWLRLKLLYRPSYAWKWLSYLESIETRKRPQFFL